MATITTPYSPMHIDCTIGQPYGNPSTGYSCGFHTGVDFPASGTGQSNPDLYACMPGTIVYLYTNETHEGGGVALGNQVQILGDNGIYYRYCHMKYGTNTHLTVGQRVDQNTYIGQMGNTGNSTGTHLHLEASTSQAWNCNNFLVPGDSLLFGNTRGTVVIYGGTPPPPPPPPHISGKNKGWWLYTKKYNIKIGR
jgi:murein DD-endopeptidase MepM/ murein hydrolase activator NlpD